MSKVQKAHLLPCRLSCGDRMVAKAQELLASMRSTDPEKRLRAVKEVKNQIIGNRHKKLSYIKLGAVPQIVELLAADSEDRLLVQCAACAGSFAYDLDDGVQALLDGGGLTQLRKMLRSPDPAVVKAGTRSLHTVYQV